jgi:hypothetical protein
VNAALRHGVAARPEHRRAERGTASATAGKARSNILGAFRNQLRAQTGKAFTPEQAAILLQLVSELPA